MTSTATTATAGPGTLRRWSMLGASTLAQASAAVMMHGPAFLIPALHAGGLGLAEAGLVVAAPTLGVMLTLVAWGAVADRYGERRTLLCGLSLTTAFGAVAAAGGGMPLRVVALVLVAVVVLDPPRPDPRAGGATNPYRRDRFLARVHGVSVLLVVPQFLVWTFALVWLVQDRSWSPAAAGSLVAAAQVAGALGRIGVGHLSDLVGSRMRPLRWVAVAAASVMGLLGLAADRDWALAVALLVVATVLTVADNGLAFTAVAERAGPSWSGRALGVQNTAQFLAASAVPPVAGLAVTHLGYAAAFALGAVFPVVAAPLVPVGA